MYFYFTSKGIARSSKKRVACLTHNVRAIHMSGTLPKLKMNESGRRVSTLLTQPNPSNLLCDVVVLYLAILGRVSSALIYPNLTQNTLILK